MDTEYQLLVFSNAFSLTHTSSDLYLSWWAHFRTQICWQGLRCCQTSNIWACVLQQLPPKRTQCGFLSSSVRRKKRKENIFLFREISLVSWSSFMGQRTLHRKIVLFRKKKYFFPFFSIYVRWETHKKPGELQIFLFYIFVSLK